jgi:dTDP-4-amino-4,6-dideoxygalactose transaminase
VIPGPGYAAFGEAERSNAEDVLRYWQLAVRAHSDPLGEDSHARRFEAEAVRVLGSRYCVSVASAGAALLTGLAALDLGPGDEIIVPGYLPAPTLAAIACRGAVPVFAEIDQSLTLDPADARAKITSKTRAVLAAHMLGAPCDLAALAEIAAQHDLYLLEDVSQACGGTYRGCALGTVGQIGVFSLDVFGVITGGGGGFLLTNEYRLLQRVRRCQDDEGEDGDVLVGLDLGMNEFTAAVAHAQLGKLDAILARTRALRAQLEALLPARPGMCRRVLHDPAGECASVLIYLFNDAATADAVAAGLGSQTLRHARKRSCPPPTAALPRTEDLLARSVAITVGVSDRGFGAVFGVNTFSGPDQIEAVADNFRTRVAQVLD